MLWNGTPKLTDIYARGLPRRRTNIGGMGKRVVRDGQSILTGRDSEICIQNSQKEIQIWSSLTLCR